MKRGLFGVGLLVVGVLSQVGGCSSPPEECRPPACGNPVQYAGNGSGGAVQPRGGSSSGGSIGGGGPNLMCEADKSVHPEACFQACGGEVVGDWVLVKDSVCFADRQVSNAYCLGDSSATPKFADIRLSFLNGGRLYGSGSEAWDVKLRGPTCDRCTRDFGFVGAFLSPESSYGEYDPNGLPSCQTCEGIWTGKFEVTYGFPLWDMSWSTEGRQLTLRELDFETSQILDYCVNGDELWIGAAATSGASYKFERAGCFGKPQPCEARSETNCTVGGGECSLGACQADAGAANPSLCEDRTEPECGAVTGCAWNAKGCRGRADFACRLESCGAEPGCELVAPTATCTGTPTVCAGREVQDCWKGCAAGTCASPTASEERDCGLAGFSFCTQADGCVDISSDCIGTTTCGKQFFEDACRAVNCEWTESATCLGTPKPCEELSLQECAFQPGCALKR